MITYTDYLVDRIAELKESLYKLSIAPIGSIEFRQAGLNGIAVEIMRLEKELSESVKNASKSNENTSRGIRLATRTKMAEIMLNQDISAVKAQFRPNLDRKKYLQNLYGAIAFENVMNCSEYSEGK